MAEQLGATAADWFVNSPKAAKTGARPSNNIRSFIEPVLRLFRDDRAQQQKVDSDLTTIAVKFKRPLAVAQIYRIYTELTDNERYSSRSSEFKPMILALIELTLNSLERNPQGALPKILDTKARLAPEKQRPITQVARGLMVSSAKSRGTASHKFATALAAAYPNDDLALYLVGRLEKEEIAKSIINVLWKICMRNDERTPLAQSLAKTKLQDQATIDKLLGENKLYLRLINLGSAERAPKIEALRVYLEKKYLK